VPPYRQARASVLQATLVVPERLLPDKQGARTRNGNTDLER